MREIVSVQVGTYSNYIGAHAWNIHDEYLSTPILSRQLSPSVVFREGSTSRLPYAPRLQLIDQSGAFGALSTTAGAVLSDPYQTSPSSTTETDARARRFSPWTGATQQYTQERIPPSEYVQHLLREELRNETTRNGHDVVAAAAAHARSETVSAENERVQSAQEQRHFGLDKGVEYWSDFLKVRLHTRTCFKLPGIHAGVSQFDKFDHGQELASIRLADEIYDDLRFFIEECDSLGCVNIISDANNGFAGLTAAYLSRIRDELGNTVPIFVAAANEASRYTDRQSSQYEPRRRLQQLFTEARLLAASVEYYAQYVPVDALASTAIKYVHPQLYNHYQSSAVLGLALNVAFTPPMYANSGVSAVAMQNLLRPAPFASLSSLFCNFPIMKTTASANAAQRGFFYNRPSIANLSTRSFPVGRTSAPQRVPRSISPQHISEVVSSRGVQRQEGVHAVVSNPVVLPVPYPRFFDSRLSKQAGSSSTNTSAPSANLCELEQVSVISGLATCARDGSNLFNNLSNVIATTAAKPSTSYVAEKSSLLESAELLRGLSQDYDSL